MLPCYYSALVFCSEINEWFLASNSGIIIEKFTFSSRFQLEQRKLSRMLGGMWYKVSDLQENLVAEPSLAWLLVLPCKLPCPM